jgi:DNA segregation ATPase FtsK/SpoIIIE, S-DNA-T family
VDVAVDGTVTARPSFGSTVTMDGEPLTDAKPWRRRSVVAVGQSLLELQHPSFPDAALKPSDDGTGLDYNRPPRITPPPRPTKFNLPAKPKQGDSRPLPWVMAGVPLVGSVSMAMMEHQPQYLFMALLSPVTMLANYMNDKKHGKTSFRKTVADYEKQKESIERQAHKAVAAETGAARDASPDPAEVLITATGPGQRLWERRRTDADYAQLRVGTGTLPSEVEVSDPAQEEHKRTAPRKLVDVPVNVPLPVHGVLGVAGRGELPRAIGRWLIAQAAVLHSPADLQICVLTDPSGRHSWEWVRWLPHARAREGQSALALIDRRRQRRPADQ